MHGNAVKAPTDAEIIDPVWSCFIKLNGRQKARQKGNGSRILHEA